MKSISNNKKKDAKFLGKSPLGASSLGRWLAALLIVLTGLIIYSNNYNNSWLFDDYGAVHDNPQIQDPLSLELLLHPGKKGTATVGRPVVALSLAFNHAVGGFEVSGYHLTNNFIHILAALALFGLIHSTLILPRFAERFADYANWYALMVALLWEAHPLLTESVNYIVCRTESMAGLFYLSTMYFAVRSFQSATPLWWYVAAVLASFLGMGSKEVMVSAPLLVLLYDYVFLSGSFKKALHDRKGFYGALASTWLVIVFYQIGLPHSVGVRFDDPSLSVLDYFRTQMTVVVHYLRLSFWPYPLVLDSQDWPIVRHWSAVLLIPGAVLGSMAGLTIMGIVRKAWWSIPGVCFFAVLAPTSSVIPLLGEIVSERRMYLPLAAVVVFVVFGVDYLWRQGVGRLTLPPKGLRLLPALLAVSVVVGMGYMTWQRNLDYRTAVAIWTDNVNKRPANYRAQENLGKAFLREGKITEAIERLRQAVRFFPANKPSDQGLGEIYSALGGAIAQKGNFREAVELHKKSIEFQPGSPQMNYRLGNTFLMANDLDNAAVAFQRESTLFPDHYRAHGNLAMVLMQKGNFGRAEYHVQELLRLSPDRGRALSVLADLRMAQGRQTEAVSVLREALTYQPDNQNIKDQLNTVLKRSQQR